MIAGSIKHTYSWSSRRVTSRRLIIIGDFGIKQQKNDPKMDRFFVISQAVPTGFEPAGGNYKDGSR
jgi:hypothetical protein